MIQVQDAYLNTDTFQLTLLKNGVVQVSFGPTHVCMTLDAALDLQYRLAGFLAHVELDDYPVQEAVEQDPRLSESRQNLVNLSQWSPSRARKLDA